MNMHIKKATNEELVLAYKELGSIWAVGKKLGMCGQSVWERLKRYGVKLTYEKFSEQEKGFLKKNYYKYCNGKLSELAIIMKRPKTSICMKAKQLGLTRPFGKGKTITEKHRTKMSVNAKERIKKHPEYLLKFNYKGGVHSFAVKQKISEGGKKSWRNLNSGHHSQARQEARSKYMSNRMRVQLGKGINPYSFGKRGKREDLGNVYFRSKWEANMARVFNFLKYKWEYEPKRFDFIDKGERRGVLSYLPDFKVYDDKTNPGNYHWYEVKGWLKARDRSSLKKFRKHYPEEFSKLKIIIQKSFSHRGKMSKPYFELLEKVKMPNEQIGFYNKYRDGFKGMVQKWE